MNAMKSILVIMPNIQKATPALHRALAYARKTGAVLNLCLFDYYAPIDYSRSIFGLEVAERARRDFLDERLRWLEDEARGIADQGLRVEIDAIWAPDACESIVAKTAELQPDLVIKDVACAGEGQHTLRPSALDWKLLRHCPAPLMLVQPNAKLLPRHVLATVDVSADSSRNSLNDAVVDTARSLAALTSAELRVASVFCHVPLAAYGSGFIADTYEIMDKAHRRSLEDFALRHFLPPAQVLRLHSYEAAETIANLADEEESDLVVLGSAHHSVMDRLLIGTTAESVLRRLHCDVLLVKPAAAEVEVVEPLVLIEEFPIPLISHAA